MNPKDLSSAKDPDLFSSVAAIQRAAMLARQVAIQTGTAIIVCQDGKIIRRTAAELIAASLNPPEAS